MNIEETITITTKETARSFAIDFQDWQSEQNLSNLEIFEWHNVFVELGEKFDLTEEFEENGII